MNRHKQLNSSRRASENAAIHITVFTFIYDLNLPPFRVNRLKCNWIMYGYREAFVDLCLSDICYCVSPVQVPIHVYPISLLVLSIIDDLM